MITGRRLIVAIFVLSGAAGLVYEVVWSRQLVLVFGNTTQAVSAILTGFFGGMAIGSALGGRLADRVRRPLRLYGLIELGLVVIVLATPLSFRLLDEVYRGAFPALETTPQLLALVRFGLALLALGPATMLMGATLPTLTRYLARDANREFSAAFGRLYAANTVGAIVGTVATGFVLIEVLGLTGALVVGAGCSGTAGALALVIDARRGVAEQRGIPKVEEPAGMGRAVPRRRRLGLPLSLALVSGLTTLAYQVLWTRLVAAGTGNSTYVFTTILAVFLLGLAIGAILFTRSYERSSDPIRLVAFGQVGTAAFVILGMAFVIDRHIVRLLTAASPLAEVFGTLVVATILVVLPATVLMGLTFPATSALVRDTDRHVGADAGLLVAANTVGSICGTFVVPFFVIPLIGSPLTIALVAGLNAIVGLGLLLIAPKVGSRRSPATALMGVAALATIVVGVGSGRLFVDPTTATVVDSGGRVYARAEDEIAPVVSGEIDGVKQLWVTGSSMTVLSVDAKLMPILPLALRPRSERALVVAFGMGSAYRSALIAGLRTDVVELVPSVPSMFGYYYSDAGRFVGDSRGRLIIADGRNFVALTQERYDVVVVDPPPPIESSGVSVISSLEFYRAVHDRLQPGGVMVQWVPYGQTIDEFRSHIAAFSAVYPHVIVAFGPGDLGTYMFGSGAPIDFHPDAIRAALSRPGVLEDLGSAIDSPRMSLEQWVSLIRSLVWIQGDAVGVFAGGAPPVTDDRPLPEYFLLRHLFGPPSPQVSRESLLAAMPRAAAHAP